MSLSFFIYFNFLKHEMYPQQTQALESFLDPTTGEVVLQKPTVNELSEVRFYYKNDVI